MAVKSPWGLINRQKIKESVLQRDTFGSLLASVQVNTIAKDVEQAFLSFLAISALPGIAFVKFRFRPEFRSAWKSGSCLNRIQF